MITMSFIFFFKQKTAYEMRISDWSSDVCSSDLSHVLARAVGLDMVAAGWQPTVENYLGRVAKPRILMAVAEAKDDQTAGRSEEHTSELQSLMRISYAVFCLKKKSRTRQ